MITIDANNKTLGRVAAEAARVLLGKHKPSFAKHVVAGDKVTVVNASKIRLSGSKTRAKVYTRYSGYPGGLKTETYEHLVSRRGHAEAIRRAVLGMLPKNRLRARRIKLLTIEN